MPLAQFRKHKRITFRAFICPELALCSLNYNPQHPFLAFVSADFKWLSGTVPIGPAWYCVQFMATCSGDHSNAGGRALGRKGSPKEEERQRNISGGLHGSILGLQSWRVHVGLVTWALAL